ncbi:hypothetical protein BGZ65_010601, partial [Modicella reniformis]
DERGLFDDESDYDDDDDDDDEDGFRYNEDEDEDEEENDDETRRLTRIRVFGHLKVMLTANMTVSPPDIKVVAVNPFATDAPEAGGSTVDY